MSDPTFALGTFASPNGRFAGLVMRNDVVGLSEGHKPFATSSHARRGVLREPISVLGLFQDWDRNFAVRPPKLLYAAANYREHVAGMRKTFRDSLAPIDPADNYQADKQKSEAYLFFKGNNCLCGPYDDVVVPAELDRIDWEAELAVVIGRQGKNIPAAKAMGPGQGRFHFRRSEWEDLPTLYHIVNALADIELIELRAASLTMSEGSTDHSNQRIVGRSDPNKAMMATALADVTS
jgi:hypothetical protein